MWSSCTAWLECMYTILTLSKIQLTRPVITAAAPAGFDTVKHTEQLHNIPGQLWGGQIQSLCSLRSFFPSLTCCVQMIPHTDNLLCIQGHTTTKYLFNSVFTHNNLPRISCRKLIMTPSIMVRCVPSECRSRCNKVPLCVPACEGQCGYHDGVCLSGLRCTLWGLEL